MWKWAGSMLSRSENSAASTAAVAVAAASASTAAAAAAAATGKGVSSLHYRRIAAPESSQPAVAVD